MVFEGGSCVTQQLAHSDGKIGCMYTLIIGDISCHHTALDASRSAAPLPLPAELRTMWPARSLRGTAVQVQPRQSRAVQV